MKKKSCQSEQPKYKRELEEILIEEDENNKNN